MKINNYTGINKVYILRGEKSVKPRCAIRECFNIRIIKACIYTHVIFTVRNKREERRLCIRQKFHHILERKYYALQSFLKANANVSILNQDNQPLFE